MRNRSEKLIIELNESYNVALANEYNNEDIKSNGKIFYGEDISITDGISAETFSIGPYQNFRDNPSGSVILYPGMNYIIEMYIVNPKQSGQITKFGNANIR